MGIKHFFLSWLLNSRVLNIYAFFFRIRRFLQPNSVKKTSSLILPPSAPGSLGDEAMMNATVAHLKAKGIQEIGIIAYKSHLEWQGLGTISDGESLNMESYFSYENTKSLKELLHFFIIASQYQNFYCLGADMMDGAYYQPLASKMQKLTSFASYMGLEARIIGFSFNEKPTDIAIQSLKHLPANIKLYARDSISHERLLSHLNRPINLVADIAFLLTPETDSNNTSKVLKWIDEQHSLGNLVIGINSSKKQLIQVYVNTLIELYSENQKVSFLFLPHDVREYQGSSDVTLAKTIFEQLPSDIKQHSLIIPIPCKAAEVKAIVAHLDLVLSGRMHVAIACLGQETPVACIVYQGKFEGLFKDFGIEEESLIIEPEKALQLGSLAPFMMAVIEKRERIRQQIQLQLPKIRERASLNFK